MDDSWNAFWLMFVCAWPFLIGIVQTFTSLRPGITVLVLSSALPALLTALVVIPPSSIYYYHFLMGGYLGLDHTGQLFLLFSSILWLASCVFAIGRFEEYCQKGFFLFFCLSMSGNFTLILAQDMLIFYFGYALMSFAFYGIFFMKSTDLTRFSALVYMCFTVISEMCIFAAFVLLESTTGTTQFAGLQIGVSTSPIFNHIMLCLFVGFGVKTGFLGLHSWLPLAHSASPIAASAVLAGAIAKVGILGWLRIMPEGGQPIVALGETLIALGVAAAFYGVLVGFTQQKLKRILAYSTVSQLGIMTVLLGLLLLLPEHRVETTFAIILYVIHHGLNKGALFLGLGQCKDEKMPNLTLWFLSCIPALSLAGLPFTSGMFAKVLLKTQIYESSGFIADALPFAVTLTSVSTAMLVAKFLYLSYPVNTRTVNLKREWVSLFSWLSLLGLSQIIIWGLFANDIDWRLTKQIGSMAAIMIGVVLGIAFTRYLSKIPVIPLGDILHLMIWSSRMFYPLETKNVKGLFHKVKLGVISKIDETASVLTQRLGWIEMHIILWPTAIALVVFFTLLLNDHLIDQVVQIFLTLSSRLGSI